MPEIDRFATYRCRVTPRLTHNGREMKPAAIVIADEEHDFVPLWLCDESDPYPGEWVFRPTDDAVWERYAALNLAWIAQGDLTFL